ncbi:MAG: hypothetical protein ABSD11_18950 [Methylocella sp.]|jgi:hypothetical protein
MPSGRFVDGLETLIFGPFQRGHQTILDEIVQTAFVEWVAVTPTRAIIKSA